MPIYEYRCAACGHELEALQKLSDAPLRDCPACHRAELRKRVSAAGFQLKGSGWYVTDFRNSGARQAAKDGVSKPNGGNGSAAAETKATPTKTGDGAPGSSTTSSAASPPTPAATGKSDG
jgi:putative FmdB family regulatory protein